MKLTALFAALFCVTVSGYATALECPAYLPAGVVIRVLPDEKLIAGTSAGPTVLSVSADVRFFPNRPPLLARGSKVLGTIVESKEAGHLHGKARLKITLGSILTSDFCEYPIDAKVVEVAKHKLKDDVVWGRGHATRDFIALIFPPTTIYQLLRLPARGPKLVMDTETPISIKLLQPVSLGASATRLSENEPVSPPQQQEVSNRVSEPCASMKSDPSMPLVRVTKVLRPVRNLTPYHVSIYLDRTPVMIMPPCFGPSMIATPATDFRLEAAASLVTDGGQKQVAVKVITSSGENGWDIVPDTAQPVAFKMK